MRYHYSLAGWQHLAVACALATHAAIVVAGEVEPYKAQVIVNRAQIRSGPGDNFYPTSTIAAGETVEVYREQPDGWLAIRPPQDSFSWVFGRHLKVGGDGLAVVDKEDVASRIGSGLGPQRNAVQLRLHQGEVVEVLGREDTRGETWYKIAPPAGEFRWLHAAQVKRLGPLKNSDAHVATTEEAHVAAEETAQTVVTTSASESTTAPVDRKPPASNDAHASVVVTAAPAGDVWRAAPIAAATSDAATADVVPPPVASIAAPPAAEATISNVAPAASAMISPAPPGAGTPETVARRLTDIELRLSRMVSAPPNLWSTEQLERDTEELLARAQTAEEREAAKAMLAKLDRFAALAQKQQPGTATTEQAAASQVAETASADGRFDAVGVLRPVVSKRPGAPQFALVDDRGQVISFVTPTPDVNLQPYLGHRVGVVGTRGFIPEFHRAHVTAGRVTPLNDRLVR